mmetsp:Transcript_23299/g.44452  ORF Transcript_23299/g.44452 Transcript_23299/m.44452 type:complete len:118 (-) Transcript_23299:307-660(-)
MVVGDTVGDVGAAVGDVVGEVGAELGEVVGDVGDPVGVDVTTVGAVETGYTIEYRSLLGEPAPKLERTFVVASFNTSFFNSIGEAEGFDCRYSAATPATYGVAIDVPDLVKAPLSLP